MLRQAIFGETKAQGSGEIAAPVALYAGEFWRTPSKNASELLPALSADRLRPGKIICKDTKMMMICADVNRVRPSTFCETERNMLSCAE